MWGKIVNDTLFKLDAREFLRVSFGPTAEDFRARISSVEHMETMEVALWDMIAPIAKHGYTAGYTEGQLVWNCLLELSFDVARQCFDAGQADVERFRLYRECKENIIKEFGSLCVEAFKTIFIQPLLSSLKLLEKYTREDSLEVSEGRCLTKYEALFLSLIHI